MTGSWKYNFHPQKSKLKKQNKKKTVAVIGISPRDQHQSTSRRDTSFAFEGNNETE